MTLLNTCGKCGHLDTHHQPFCMRLSCKCNEYVEKESKK